ncbi:MAG: CPBP family intramembrane metalloprotease [Gammaproteobacteria bacterium]|nr:CPBP family intramembrane metalloprotease [Gammaproteobacteria bacterium]
MLLSNKMNSPWDFRQGMFILVSFIVVYCSLSAGHMLLVKATVGFDNYLKNDTDFYTKVLLGGQIIKAMAILIAIKFVALNRYQLNWEALGFVKTSTQWILVAVFISLIGLVLRFLLMKWMVTEVPAWIPFVQPPLKDLAISFSILTFFLIFTVVITPIVEEIFFRGFLFKWFAGRKPIWLAALISSAMFGASHIIPPQAISAALMSFLIIYLYVASGSIWPPIVCHIVNNALSIVGNLLASTHLLPDFLMPPGIS